MKKSLMGFAALVLIVTAAFAFTTVSHKFTTVYYQYTGANPPTTTTVTTTTNWTSISAPLTYTSGTNLYFIEFDNVATNLAGAEQILSANLPLTDNQSYSLTINGVLETVKVHLKR